MKPIAICVWQDCFIYHGFASRPHENKSSAPNCWTTPMDGAFHASECILGGNFFHFSFPSLLGSWVDDSSSPNSQNQMPHNLPINPIIPIMRSGLEFKFFSKNHSNNLYVHIEVVIFRYQWCNFSLQHAAEDFVQLCLSDGSVGDLLTRSCHRRTDGLA